LIFEENIGVKFMATYKLPDGTTLYTSFVYPSIPIRQFDWSCVDDNYDGAPDAGPQCHGSGATEQEAINDYFEQRD
jgi:hypothetical protein